MSCPGRIASETPGEYRKLGPVPMSRVVQSTEVLIPAHIAYRQWTDFESFPAFMYGVDSVAPLDATSHRWAIRIGGVSRTFDSQITEQKPDERVAWRSVSADVRHSGVVTLEHVDDSTTRVTTEIEWEPNDLVERAAVAAGVVDYQIGVDLCRFKSFVELGPYRTWP
jgi:uncharacterized membrane protein